MASFFKFDQFIVDWLIDDVHDLHADTIKVYLTNAPPDAADEIKADLAEIAAGNGYSAGGQDIANTASATGGVYTVTATDITWTASGGQIGPFRAAVAYNDTPVSPVDPLIGAWDRGSSLTLDDGESFTLDFSGNALLTVE